MFKNYFTVAVRNFKSNKTGARKALSASVSQIGSLLAKDFISFVLVSFLIALPIVWWAMSNRIQDFVYRTSLIGWVFTVTFAGMILIALLILSIRTIKSAIENPVRALRSE